MSIHGLPVELLVDIFQHVLILGFNDRVLIRDYPYYPTLYTLMQVSAIWAQLIKETPWFWGRIDSGDPVDLWETALKRSGNYPLEVINVNTATSSSWSVISCHLPRWESARIRLSERVDVSALESAAPNLKRFDLEWRGSTETVSTDLFKEYAPDLVHLQLRHVRLKSWTTTILRGLTYLSLWRIASPGPSLLQVISILRECPELEYLALGAVSIAECPLSTPAIPVMLGSLAAISINTIHSGPNADPVHQLLSLLRLPHCTRYQLWSSSNTTLPTKPYDCITPSLTTSLMTAESLHIGALNRHFALRLYTSVHPAEQEAFRLVMSCTHYEPLLSKWISPMLRLKTPPLPLTLRITLRHISQSDRLVLFEETPGITSLAFECVEGGMDEVLEKLAVPVTRADGTLGWLCPDLREIHLGSSVYADEGMVLGMVQSRMAAAMDQETGSKRHGPAVLDSLRVSGRCRMTRDVFEQINATLGGLARWEPHGVMFGQEGSVREELDGADAHASVAVTT